MKNKIYVSQPALPPLEEFIPYLRKIWGSKILTNNGAYHQQLELELCKYLGVKFISLFCNGTMALITALKALNLKGEIITSPYSFVGTSHALLWGDLQPVFVDIEPDFYTLDPEKIEDAITPLTSAILPVHVYGNPCKVKEIQKVADKHGLKVIYDACHTFGVKADSIPLLNFGDLSVMSFHATKVFTTFEGGAIICNDEDMKRQIDRMKNFGFVNQTSVIATGINAKMNELQAAMGLLQLQKIDTAIFKRKLIAELYRKKLRLVQGIRFLDDMPDTSHCYSYFPIFVNKEKYGISRDELFEKLKTFNIYCRRYFYPLISQLPMYRDLESAQPENLPVAEKTTQEVICLPIYPDLQFEDIIRISEIVHQSKTV